MLLRRDLGKIGLHLKELDEARDRVLELSRNATRLSDQSILQMHREDLEEAKKTLRMAENTIRKLNGLLAKSPELKHSGNVLTAYQEYGEAKLLLTLIAKRRVPSMGEVGVEPIPYLLGILDFIGELRRLILNYLRAGESNEAEETLEIMEKIYHDVLSIDHTAIIPTFRRKADVARKLVETTRGDVVTEVRRMSLEKAIRSLEVHISSRVSK